MQTIDRPEGFKEKRAELVISHLYHLDGRMSSGEMAAPTPEKVVPINAHKSNKTEVQKPVAPVSTGDFEYDASYELSNPSAWQPSGHIGGGKFRRYSFLITPTELMALLDFV